MAARPWRADRGLTTDWRAHYEQIWKPMSTPSTEPREHMTLEQFQAARQVLRNALRQFEVVVPNCRSCTRFSMGTCSEFGEIPTEFQQQPEACESWQYDGIPL